MRQIGAILTEYKLVLLRNSSLTITNLHQRDLLGQLMMDSSSQQNTCFDCGKSFENNRAFFNHKRVHQKVDCRHCNSSIPVNSKKIQ